MATKQIGTYQVQYAANSFVPRIWRCRDTNEPHKTMSRHRFSAFRNARVGRAPIHTARIRRSRSRPLALRHSWE